MSKSKATHVGRECPVRDKCRDDECRFNHSKRKECRFGTECTRRGCWYNHPENSASRTGGAKKQNGGQVLMCRYGKMCKTTKFCVFNHPGRLECRNGNDCYSRLCWFNHPTLICIHRNCKRKEDDECPYRHPTWLQGEESEETDDDDSEDESDESSEDEDDDEKVEVKKGDKKGTETSVDKLQGAGTSKNKGQKVENLRRKSEGKGSDETNWRQPYKNENKRIRLPTLEAAMKDLGFNDFVKPPSPPPPQDMTVTKRNQEVSGKGSSSMKTDRSSMETGNKGGRDPQKPLAAHGNAKEVGKGFRGGSRSGNASQKSMNKSPGVPLMSLYAGRHAAHQQLLPNPPSILGTFHNAQQIPPHPTGGSFNYAIPNPFMSYPSHRL